MNPPAVRTDIIGVLDGLLPAITATLTGGSDIEPDPHPIELTYRERHAVTVRDAGLVVRQHPHITYRETP